LGGEYAELTNEIVGLRRVQCVKYTADALKARE